MKGIPRASAQTNSLSRQLIEVLEEFLKKQALFFRHQSSPDQT
jgi:hypothetical protein